MTAGTHVVWSWACAFFAVALLMFPDLVIFVVIRPRELPGDRDRQESRCP